MIVDNLNERSWLSKAFDHIVLGYKPCIDLLHRSKEILLACVILLVYCRHPIESVDHLE